MIPFFRVGDTDRGVLVTKEGAKTVTFVAAPPPPPSGDVLPAMKVDYVDGSGVLQSVDVVNGVTSISGTAPFMMHLDASGSRFPTAYAAQGTFADEESFAFWMGGYRLNYGDSVGGTWTFGGGSRDEDLGPPVFGRVFETTGTHTVRLKCRDALGNESTLSFTVVVSAPASPTIIETAAGAWPTWVSGTHYALRAGGNYTSFGALDFRERHNVIISKTGAGADPIVGTFRPDGRGVIDAAENTWSLGRGIRTWNIDVANFAEGGVQFIHCGVVGGRCRAYSEGIKDYIYSNDTTNANTRASVRRGRGVFLWNCGEVGRGDSTYVMIGGARHRHLVGADFVMSGDVGASVACMRLYDHESTIRHSRISNTYQDGLMQTWISMIGYGDIASYPGYSPQPWTDQIGQSASLAKILSTPRKFIANRIVFGQVGMPWPNAPGSIGGPVNESWVSELFGLEDCTIALAEPTGYGVNSSVTMTGRWHASRNVKYNNGAGGSLSISSSNGPDASYNGPRLIESTNSRPVPSAF